MGKHKSHFPKFAVIMTVGMAFCLFFAVYYYIAYFQFEATMAGGGDDIWESLGLIFAFAGAGSTFLAYGIWLTIGAAIFLILAIIFYKRRI